jgi:hypothetical protein
VAWFPPLENPPNDSARRAREEPSALLETRA